jgi:hypothetical protein
MKRRDKLLLLLVTLIVGLVGLGAYLWQGKRSEPVVAQAPAAPAKARPERVDALPPPEATAVDDYLADRWGHMEEPIVAPMAEGTGDRLYLMKNAIQGRTADGEPLYAVGMARLHKFDNIKTYKKKDFVQGAALQVEGYDPTELLKRFGKPKRVPLDQLPDGEFEHRPPNVPLEPTPSAADSSPTGKQPKKGKKGAGGPKKGKKGGNGATGG